MLAGGEMLSHGPLPDFHSPTNHAKMLPRYFRFDSRALAKHSLLTIATPSREPAAMIYFLLKNGRAAIKTEKQPRRGVKKA